jgi:hypothetical protein
MRRRLSGSMWIIKEEGWVERRKEDESPLRIHY